MGHQSSLWADPKTVGRKCFGGVSHNLSLADSYKRPRTRYSTRFSRTDVSVHSENDGLSLATDTLPMCLYTYRDVVQSSMAPKTLRCAIYWTWRRILPLDLCRRQHSRYRLLLHVYLRPIQYVQTVLDRKPWLARMGFEALSLAHRHPAVSLLYEFRLESSSTWAKLTIRINISEYLRPGNSKWSRNTYLDQALLPTKRNHTSHHSYRNLITTRLNPGSTLPSSIWHIFLKIFPESRNFYSTRCPSWHGRIREQQQNRSLSITQLEHQVILC